MRKTLLITGFLLFGLAMFILGIIASDYFDRDSKLHRTYQIAGSGFQGAVKVFEGKE